MRVVGREKARIEAGRQSAAVCRHVMNLNAHRAKVARAIVVRDPAVTR